MRTKKFYLMLLFVLFSCSLIFGQALEGKVIQTTIPAPSLQNNILYIPDEQLIAIYLPPSYDKSDRHYPVVYYLPGFGDYVYYYTYYGVFQGYSLQSSMAGLINQGKITEMIVVIINGQFFSGGSFYVNSPVTGNWEDFVVKDVVGYIDKNYRTKAESKFRAISGHSMGGFGSINIAMHHPDVFGIVYSLAPGLFDQNGLKKTIMFNNDERIRQFPKLLKKFEKLGPDQAKAKYINYVANLLAVVGDFYGAFDFAYGMAFAPNPDGNVPFIDYPYTETDGKLVLNETAWKKYENGFGSLAEKVAADKSNLLKLKGIVIDVGNQDNYEWIREGCDYFHKLLNDNGINNDLVKYDGGHQDKLRERIENFMLPYFSKKFNE